MTEHIISVSALTVKRQNRTILDNLHFTVGRGECIAILGPNGAGKSTLIDVLLGRLAPAQGSCHILQQQPGASALRQQLGIMLQSATLPANNTVSEYLHLFRSYYHKPISYQHALQFSGLTTAESQRFSELSGGQKQRLLFALALLGDPQVLFLDEPSLAMDAAMRREMWQQIKLLKQQGKTIVLTTHYLEEADALADSVFVLKQGQFIASGSPCALKAADKSSRVKFYTHTPYAILLSLLPDTPFTIEEHWVSLQTPEASQILQRLFAAGVQIDDLSVTPHSLEDTFLTLTEEQAA
ncbi:ABC transporter ATP-binding protein [Pseudoalteromonas fenneropenaei]|uniref:ABC transporter ATP-binding protein n=1 Tax=Pseudoalteromonas fenneropenaei TaxID=1737459 RepID=A0ABV7CLD1_9GAMM